MRSLQQKEQQLKASLLEKQAEFDRVTLEYEEKTKLAHLSNLQDLCLESDETTRQLLKRLNELLIEKSMVQTRSSLN